MRIAVGTVSFDDCEALTWSLGWTPSPTAADANVEMTSLTFMFVDVPDPVWKTSIGKCSSSSPASTRRAASAIASAISAVTPGTDWVGVDGGGVALDPRQRLGDADVEGAAGDREVAHREIGLRAPESPGRIHVFTLRRAAARPHRPTIRAVPPADAFDAILFDLDGVLTPTADIHQLAWKTMFDEFLVPRGRRARSPTTTTSSTSTAGPASTACGRSSRRAASRCPRAIRPIRPVRDR